MDAGPPGGFGVHLSHLVQLLQRRGEELFAPLSEALDNQTMQDLNAQVDVEGEDPADVARTFLEEQGLLGG